MTCRQQINQSSAGRRRGLLRLVSSTPKEPGDCGCPLWPKHEPVGGDPRGPPALPGPRQLASQPPHPPPPLLFPYPPAPPLLLDESILGECGER